MATSRSTSALTAQVRTGQPVYNKDTGQQLPAGSPLAGLSSLGPSARWVLGWAPKIGHITTTAATSKRRKTVNPLAAAATPSTVGRKSNPFAIEQAPSADLFGLNLAV